MPPEIRAYIFFFLFFAACVTVFILLYKQQVKGWKMMQRDFNLQSVPKIMIRYYPSESGWRGLSKLYIPFIAELYIKDNNIIITTKPRSLLTFNLHTLLPVVITNDVEGTKKRTKFWRVIKPDKIAMFGKYSIEIEYSDLFQPKRKYRIIAKVNDVSRTNEIQRIIERFDSKSDH